MKRSIFAPPPVVKVPKDKLQHINDLDTLFTSKETPIHDLVPNGNTMNYIKNNLVNSYEDGLRAITSRNYIVGSLSNTGDISFTTNPTIHPTKEGAKREAERLAKTYTGKTFIFVQFVGAVASNSVQYF